MRSTGYHVDKIIQITIGIDALLLKVNNFEILASDEFTVAQMPQLRAKRLVRCEYTFSVEKYFAVLCDGPMRALPICEYACGDGRNERIKVYKYISEW